jgi:hypothetical protein
MPRLLQDIDVTSITLNGIPVVLPFVQPLGTGYMIVIDEKANGTNGGNSVAGTQTRTLNTVKTNNITDAFLAANQITLPAGTYRITASAPASTVGRHKAWLQNMTDAAIAIDGTAEFSNVAVQSRAIVKGKITIASVKAFEIQHFTSLIVASGLGIETGLAGHVETYTIVEIIKE